MKFLKMLHRYKQNHAFTLIEIMLVVILISIVTTLTTVHFSKSYGRLRLRQTCENMAYVLRYAKSRAVHKRGNVRMVFNGEKSSYWLEGVSDEDNEMAFWTEPETFSNTSESYQPLTGNMGRNFAVPSGVVIEIDNPVLEFFPDGQISKSRIYVCREMPCSKGDEDCREDCMTVSTLDVAGEVRVFDYRAE